jgi:hypothetical protein
VRNGIFGGSSKSLQLRPLLDRYIAQLTKIVDDEARFWAERMGEKCIVKAPTTHGIVRHDHEDFARRRDKWRDVGHGRREVTE